MENSKLYDVITISEARSNKQSITLLLIKGVTYFKLNHMCSMYYGVLKLDNCGNLAVVMIINSETEAMHQK